LLRDLASWDRLRATTATYDHLYLVDIDQLLSSSSSFLAVAFAVFDDQFEFSSIYPTSLVDL
jgi:hypothetical protein